MPTVLSNIFGRLSTTVRGFTVPQRTIAIIGVAVLLLGAAALGTWATKPALTPLFSGLKAEDASAIVEQLRTANVTYELADGGATILVPQEHVYDERLKAASAGLPAGTDTGYALLDAVGMTSSEFQQSVSYKRALEGELARTITAMDGVKSASVQLAIPKESVFISEKANPTASVFISTSQGVSLSNDQVQAIVHLTSASIENMQPTDVAVIDSTGVVLSAVGTGQTGSGEDRASAYQEGVRMSVQTMLDKMVGPGNASVVVAADINQESASRVEESFSAPEGALALTESVDSTIVGGGAGGLTAGVLGPDNIAVPDATTTTNADGTTTTTNADGTTSTSTVRTNAINKVTETRTIPAGALSRQTVSVALNASAAAAVNVGEVSDLVTAAAGLDPARGDSVVVKVVQFNKTGAEDAAKALADAAAAETADRVQSLVTTGIITLGIVLPIVLALILFSRRSKREERESIDVGSLSDILNAPTGPMKLGSQDALDMASMSPFGELSELDRKKSDIKALADSDPGRTAEYLRSLMEERQTV